MESGSNVDGKTNELPILVLQEIFSLLNWSERLKCKLVSKQWKFVIETSSLQSLCICNEKIPHSVNWCFSDQKILHKDILYLNPKKNQNFKSRIGIFQDIQKLCFFKIEIGKFLKDLHLFRKLKVLMIERYCKVNQRRPHKVTLKSSSLEKLSFKHTGFSGTNLELIDFNTPILKSLVFWNDTIQEFPIKFRFPLTIQHLECIKFDSNMKVLKNLETLVCESIICSFTLEDFRSLRRLELFPWKETELSYIQRIVNEKNHLGRDELEILVCGFKDILVAFHSQLGRDPRSLPYLNDDFLGSIVKNSDNFVGRIPWQIYVDINVFYKTFTEIPKDFFKKFANIDKIEIENFSRRPRKCNAPYVLQLLIQTNPRHVEISYLNYNENHSEAEMKRFYEQLTLIQSIEWLIIKEANVKNIDYDYFLNLKYLDHLYIFTERLPNEFISKIFKNTFINSFGFFCSSCIIIISFQRYRGYYVFDLDDRSRPKALEYGKSFSCLDDLTDYVKKFKNENRTCLLDCLV